MMNIRALAFYLPQFHTIPENDAWWGKGFTDWTNVGKSLPLFKGHYQPHVPTASLNYYDLQDSKVLNVQAELAKKYGISGFVFYHYWFSGKKLLQGPIETLLKSGTPSFPFCLCWANENWTRRWDGHSDEVLIEQKYSFDDDLKHIQYLLPYFSDRRYIRVNGKPVFIVYRTELFPDIRKTADIWRKEAIKAGIGDLYLIRAESFVQGLNPADIGFDAALEHQPNWNNLPPRYSGSLLHRILQKTRIKKFYFLDNAIVSYHDYVKQQINNSEKINYKRYPGITPMFDNTARRKKGAFIMIGSTPEE